MAASALTRHSTAALDRPTVDAMAIFDPAAAEHRTGRRAGSADYIFEAGYLAVLREDWPV